MEITGIILAGGHSRRMGTDKALLELGGIPLVALTAARLSQVADTVVIACGEEERKDYQFLRLPMVIDRYPDLGPLAGLHATLRISHTEWSAAVACDLPFAGVELLNFMKEIASTESSIQAVVPVNAAGKAQPLLAFYHRSVLPSLEESLMQKRLRVMEWLDNLAVRYVQEKDFPLSMSDRGQGMELLNMNTPAEYLAAVKLASFLFKGDHEV
ncbi:molybdenum cofactor guanylyltransferase [Paenibacillus sp. 19GGS1-52]|uniref:molybdenum cofactor guanylyltransferase n=1 Tax=Paenibacillus sp. 19GGS1-52 TaxID=2758563 RepID=UPI001EFB9B4D|nr:molybdenum cofactor guanylyltransferase [Paenibacillus sp. 19GGS1-52]ULO07878.1 molybdenum cofactor guanylyltransferase [Paenibacillus sp. 19GGS1-52]